MLFFSQSVTSSSFVTPWTVAHQAPLSMGFPRREYWRGLPFPSSEYLPDPGIEPLSLALADEFFATEPPGKPTEIIHIRKCGIKCEAGNISYIRLPRCFSYSVLAPGTASSPPPFFT